MVAFGSLEAHSALGTIDCNLVVCVTLLIELISLVIFWSNGFRLSFRYYPSSPSGCRPTKVFISSIRSAWFIPPVERFAGVWLLVLIPPSRSKRWKWGNRWRSSKWKVLQSGRQSAKLEVKLISNTHASQLHFRGNSPKVNYTYFFECSHIR